MLWQGCIGGVCWSYFVGDISDLEVQHYFDHLGCHPNTLHLTIAFHGGIMSHEQMQWLADILQEGETFIQPKAHALALETRKHRAALAVLNDLLKKPYPERAFGSPRRALEWLATIWPINPEPIWEAIADSVPAEHLWEYNG
jgi:hypothetical protein